MRYALVEVADGRQHIRALSADGERLTAMAATLGPRFFVRAPVVRAEALTTPADVAVLSEREHSYARTRRVFLRRRRGAWGARATHSVATRAARVVAASIA